MGNSFEIRMSGGNYSFTLLITTWFICHFPKMNSIQQRGYCSPSNVQSPSPSFSHSSQCIGGCAKSAKKFCRIKNLNSSPKNVTSMVFNYQYNIATFFLPLAPASPSFPYAVLFPLQSLSSDGALPSPSSPPSSSSSSSSG